MQALGRSRLPRLPALAAVLLAMAAPAPAAADEKANELFQDGLREMLEGRYESACPLLAESARIEPLAGTIFTLAECEAKRGRIATAVRHYDSYLALFTAMTDEKKARQRGRERIAADQKAVLGPQVPLLTLTLASGAPEGTVVRRDGEVLDRSSLGLQEPVDPGEHVITVTPPNGAAEETRVQLDKGQSRALVLEVGAGGPEKVVPPPPETANLVTHGPATRPPIDRAGARKIASLTTGASGLVTIALGLAAGGVALSEKPKIEAGCQGTSTGGEKCTLAGKAAADRARDFAAVATAGVASGLGALAAAGVLYYLATPAKTPSTTGKPAPKGAVVRWAPLVSATPEGHGTGMLGVSGVW